MLLEGTFPLGINGPTVSAYKTAKASIGKASLGREIKAIKRRVSGKFGQGIKVLHIIIANLHVV